MRPSTLAELAEHGRDPGARDPGLRLVQRLLRDLPRRLPGAQTPDDFARLVYEVVEDSVLDGAVWVEPSFYAPHHRNRFGDGRGRSSTWCSTPLARRGRAARRGRRADAWRPTAPSSRRCGRAGALAATRADRGRRVVRARQRRGHRAARALRRGVRHRQGGRPALDAARGRAGGAGVGVGRARHARSPTACSTACARSRTPSW